MSELREHAELPPDAAAGFRFAVIVSRFNRDITGALLDGTRATLVGHGAADSDIVVYDVPGAFELPIVAARLADDDYDAIICLGAVIKGQTPHFDYLCLAVANGIQEVAIRSGVPAIFGVLTCERQEHAEARAGGKKGNRGVEAAIAAIEMVNLLSALPTEGRSDGQASPSS